MDTCLSYNACWLHNGLTQSGAWSDAQGEDPNVIRVASQAEFDILVDRFKEPPHCLDFTRNSCIQYRCLDGTIKSGSKKELHIGLGNANRQHEVGGPVSLVGGDADRAFVAVEPLKKGDKVFCHKEVKGTKLSRDRVGGIIDEDIDPTRRDVLVRFGIGPRSQVQARPLKDIIGNDGTGGTRSKGGKHGAEYRITYPCSRRKEQVGEASGEPKRQQQRNKVPLPGAGCTAKVQLIKWPHDPTLYADFSESLCKCNSESLCGCIHNHEIGEANIPFQAVSKSVMKFAEGLIRSGNTEPKAIVSLVHQHVGNYGKSNVGEDGRAINVSGADASNFNAKTAINLVSRMKLEQGTRKDASDKLSVEGWVEQMKAERSLLAFTQKGSKTIELKEAHGYITRECSKVGLSSEDFMLSFQTPRQAVRMTQFMSKFVATDSTHHTTGFDDFQLFVMLVADEQEAGEPVSYSLQSSGAHTMLSIWLQLLKDNGLAPTQTMQDCDLAEALAFQLVFGGDEFPPQTFYCIWHVLKAVRANMKKCGEACRPGGPSEKFAAAGPTHASEKLAFLLTWTFEEILQYATAAKLNIGSMAREQLANKIIEHDSKQERLSDGDLLDPDPRFRNESTIRREQLARGIKWICTGLSPSVDLHMNVVELFRNEVLPKGLLGELQVRKPPAKPQTINGQTGLDAHPVVNAGGTNGVVTFGDIWELFKSVLMAPTFERFNLLEKEMLEKCSGSAFHDYYMQQWHRHAEKWALYAMEDRYKIRTNMYVEAFNKVLKYNWFNGLRNMRVDDLVYMLYERIEAYYFHRSESYALGTGPRSEVQMQRDLRAIAAQRICDENQDGFANANAGTFIHEVPSEKTTGLMYTTDVAANTCTCPDRRRQLDHADQSAKDLGCCKHLLAARIYRGEVIGTSAPRPLDAADNNQLVLRPYLEGLNTPERLAQARAFLKDAEAYSASGGTGTRKVLETVMQAVKGQANTLPAPQMAPRAPISRNPPENYDKPLRIGNVQLERQRPKKKRAQVGTLQSKMGGIPDGTRCVRQKKQPSVTDVANQTRAPSKRLSLGRALGGERRKP